MSLLIAFGLLSVLAMAWLTRPLWRQSWPAALTLALLLPLSSLFFYYYQGSWRTQQLISQAASDPQAAQQQMILGMVQRLAARLQQQPDDAEGWAMLGRSYTVLGRPVEATQAYARALQVDPDHPQALWFTGLAALEAGDRKTAARHWRRLLKQDLPDSLRAELQARLNEIQP